MKERGRDLGEGRGGEGWRAELNGMNCFGHFYLYKQNQQALATFQIFAATNSMSFVDVHGISCYYFSLETGCRDLDPPLKISKQKYLINMFLGLLFLKLKLLIFNVMAI